MSIFLDGSDYLTIPDSDDFNFGSGDWTIDFWYYPTSLGSIAGLLTIGQGSNDYAPIIYAVHTISPYTIRGDLNKVDLVDVTVIAATATSTENVWQHLAMVRNVNTLKIYLDGVEIASTDVTGVTFMNTANPSIIGSDGFGNYFTGYIDELRISDTARWTADFSSSLPTEPYTSDANTLLLLHMNGDVSNSDHPVTSISTPQLDAATTKFDGAMYFGGAGSGDYLSIPDNDDFNFGSDNFTIDLWASLDSGLQHQFCRQGPPTGDNSNNLVWWVGTDKKLSFLYSPTGSGWTTVTSTEAATFNYNEWTHFAVVRDLTDLTFYVNGIKVGDSIDIGTAIFYNSTALFTIGAGTSGGIFVSRLKGYLDEFRISRIARWTTEFAPDGEYTDEDGIDEYTKLMLHMNGDDDGTDFPDDSDSNHTATPVNDAVTKTGEKKLGSASGYFDGVGDYLSVPDSDDWALDNIWTLDTWVYLTDTSVNYLLSQDKDGNNRWAFGVNSSRKLTWNMKVGGSWSTPEPLSSGNVPLNEWVHIAAVNDGTNLKLYINGINDGTYSSRALPNMAAILKVGAGYDSWYFTGYIDELRISRGIARWTSDFNTGFVPNDVPYTFEGIDLTTFTEIDPNSDITVDSSTKVSFVTMRRDAVAGLYKDMGVGYVTGDFEFQWYFYISAGTNTSVATYFSLSEAFYLTRIDKYDVDDGLEISFLQGQNISLSDFKTGNSDTISVVSAPPFGWWAKLVRSGTTVTFTIYTDAERTSVAGTAQIVQTSAYTYRYLYPITSLDSPTNPSEWQSGYIEDIEKIS